MEKNATQQKKAKEFSGHFLSLFFIGDSFHIGGRFSSAVNYLRFQQSEGLNGVFATTEPTLTSVYARRQAAAGALRDHKAEMSGGESCLERKRTLIHLPRAPSTSRSEAASARVGRAHYSQGIFFFRDHEYSARLAKCHEAIATIMPTMKPAWTSGSRQPQDGESTRPPPLD